MTNMVWSPLFTVFVVTVILIGLKKIRWEYALYAIGAVLLYVSFTLGQGDARYSLPIFPMYIILAQIKNKYLLAAIMAIFVILLLFFTVTFTHGLWAF